MTKLEIPMNQRVCLFCNKSKTHDSWYNVNNEPCCMVCYYREINYKTTGRKRDIQRHSKRITFRGKRLYNNHTPRNGYCSRCPNNIHDGSAKRTSMHHITYDETNILKDTVELCNSCHAYETWKKRKEMNKKYE